MIIDDYIRGNNIIKNNQCEIKSEIIEVRKEKKLKSKDFNKLNLYTLEKLGLFFKNFSLNFLEKYQFCNDILQFEPQTDLFTPNFLAFNLSEMDFSSLEGKFQWGTIELFIDSLIRNSYLSEARSLLNVLFKAQASDNIKANERLSNSKQNFPKFEKAYQEKQNKVKNKCFF